MARVGQAELESQAARFLASLEARHPHSAASARAYIDGTEPPPAPKLPATPKRVMRNDTRNEPVKQTHRQGRPAHSRQEQRRRVAERIRQRESRHMKALQDRVAAIGGTPTSVRGIPLRVWVMCLQVVADPTGRAARIWLRRTTNRVAAGAILAAALGRARVEDANPLKTGVKTGSAHPRTKNTPKNAEDLEASTSRAGDRSWASLRTRRIAAFGLSLLYLSRRTGRDGPWGAVVMGVPRGALAALLRDPYDTTPNATPAITTLFGTHRPGADPLSSQVGYFVTLREHGFVYRQQLPAAEAQRSELWGPSGYAFNRYWLPTERTYTIDDDDVREVFELLKQIADTDARALTAEARHKPPPN